MFGTLASSCVAALGATVVPLETKQGQRQDEQAILPLDNLIHSRLFRRVPDPSGHAVRVEYRTMTAVSTDRGNPAKDLRDRRDEGAPALTRV